MNYEVSCDVISVHCLVTFSLPVPYVLLRILFSDTVYTLPSIALDAHPSGSCIQQVYKNQITHLV